MRLSAEQREPGYAKSFLGRAVQTVFFAGQLPRESADKSLSVRAAVTDACCGTGIHGFLPLAYGQG